jgi:predicted  nucleic acid-binding Zn-ribbon protein
MAPAAQVDDPESLAALAEHQTVAEEQLIQANAKAARTRAAARQRLDDAVTRELSWLSTTVGNIDSKQAGMAKELGVLKTRMDSMEQTMNQISAYMNLVAAPKGLQVHAEVKGGGRKAGSAMSTG